MSRTALSRLLSVSCLVASLAGAASAGPPPPVVGGEPSPAGRWPDTAAVMDAGITICTGTLIAPQVVLTAGHCVEGLVGEVKLDAIDADGPGEVIAVTDAIAYPDWETTYDIAVLLLAEPSTIPPRPLATQCVVTESLVASAPVTLVGYGATTPGGEDLNTTLMEGDARIIDADCVGGNGCAPAVVPGGEFVAGGAGVDSCFGDSGGPVYLPTPYGTVVAGVVSRGLDDSPTPCGGGGIYVRPDSVLDWIEETAGPVTLASCPPPPPVDPGDDTDDSGGDAGGGGQTGEDLGSSPTPSTVTGGCSATDRGARGMVLILLGLLVVLALRRRS